MNVDKGRTAGSLCERWGGRGLDMKQYRMVKGLKRRINKGSDGCRRKEDLKFWLRYHQPNEVGKPERACRVWDLWGTPVFQGWTWEERVQEIGWLPLLLPHGIVEHRCTRAHTHTHPDPPHLPKCILWLGSENSSWYTPDASYPALLTPKHSLTADARVDFFNAYYLSYISHT